jgi:hypothetical protein
VYATTWSKQIKQLSWTDSRAYGELLVVGIVVLSLVALLAWEAVGRSDKMLHRWGRKPYCCSDDKSSPCPCNELSTLDLISKCVRGVCEL